MRRFRRIKVDKDALPMVRRLAEEMMVQRIGLHDMADRTGVSATTLERWFYQRGNPSVANIEACFNVLGMTIIPRRTSRVRGL